MNQENSAPYYNENVETLNPFGDAVLLNQVQALREVIETLPPSVHVTRLHQMVYDTQIALSSLQTTGDYVWPQPQFQLPREALSEPPPELLSDADAYPAKPSSNEVASELVDNQGVVVEEVPSMQVLAARFHQALVMAGVDFPVLTHEQTALVQEKLEDFLKDPSVNTNDPFLITDPYNSDHLLKVTFEGFNIKVESTLPSKKPDQPLTPVDVLSNPINALPIFPFFSFQELLGDDTRMKVFKANYPKAEGKASIFDQAIPTDEQGSPRRRSTDTIEPQA